MKMNKLKVIARSAATKQSQKEEPMSKVKESVSKETTKEGLPIHSSAKFSLKISR